MHYGYPLLPLYMHQLLFVGMFKFPPLSLLKLFSLVKTLDFSSLNVYWEKRPVRVNKNIYFNKIDDSGMKIVHYA